MGYAKVDHHRALRQNAAEVIYGEGKTPDQICGIAESLQQGGAKTVLVTRMKPEAVKGSFFKESNASAGVVLPAATLSKIFSIASDSSTRLIKK